MRERKYLEAREAEVARMAFMARERAEYVIAKDREKEKLQAKEEAGDKGREEVR